MTSVQDSAGSQPRLSKKARLKQLVDAPDQLRIRAELTEFFGPRAEVYLETYEKMRGGTEKNQYMVFTWSWPVFLGSFVWFFYRKLHLYGAFMVLMPIALSYVTGATAAGGGSVAVFAVYSKYIYVHSALSRIIKADDLGLAGQERLDYLHKAGGVSLTAGLFAGLIYILGLAAAIYGAFYQNQ